MKTHIFVFVFLLLFAPSLCFSVMSASDAGTKGANFLKLGVGAKPIGMGSAYTAVPFGSADMVYWNPAGLAALEKKEATFMYSSYFVDIAYGWVSFAAPVEDYGVFAGAVQYLSYGGLDERDLRGDPGADSSYFDVAVYLSYANYYVFENYGIFDYGASLKYIYSKIEDSDWTVAFDVGVKFTLEDEITSFGMVFQNLGAKLQYDETAESLPAIFKAGASRILFDKLLLSVDVNFPSDNEIFPSLGAEYKIDINESAGVFLRAGYNGIQKDVPGFAGFNAGFGIQYEDYLFDYAFSPYGDLGSAHRVSAGIKFGAKESSPAQKEEKKEAKPKPAAVKNKKQPVKERKEKEEAAERSVGQDSYLSENDDVVEGSYGVDSGVYEGGYNFEEAQDEPVVVVDKNAKSAAVLTFTSKQIQRAERVAYTEMLRKALSSTGRFKTPSKRASEDLYSKNSVPSLQDIEDTFKLSGADIVIICNIELNGNNLEFDIHAYDSQMRVQQYFVESLNSFKDARKQLTSAAEKF